MKATSNVITFICSGVHMSRSTDLTFDIWVPMLRWMPEQRMHTKTPLLAARIHQQSVICAASAQCSLTYSTMPIVGLAIPQKRHQQTRQVGSPCFVPFRLQSAHTLFSGRLTSSRSVFAFRSVVALSCFDISSDREYWWCSTRYPHVTDSATAR